VIYCRQVQNKLSKNVLEQIELGVQIIRKGGVIVFPTDTLYGLGAGAFCEAGIRRVFEIKQRPLTMALPLLLGDVSQIHEVAEHLPDYAWRLVDRFLPGGLTLVVRRSSIVKDIITAGGDTVAIRIPDHPVALALIRESGMPVVGTSANLSGHSNVLSVSDLRKQLEGKVDLIIDGGPAPGGKESTVVDVTNYIAEIIREGAISRAEVQQVVKLKGD
jgi:L-threonylcarbamoyladenylate synthase